MRSIKAALFAFVVLASAAAGRAGQKTDLTGAWTFTWDKDPKNVNRAELKQEGAALTGTYFNDAEDACSVEGRAGPAHKVVLTITCPKWGIECEGSVKGKHSVAGAYVAYGSSKGEFAMSRKPKAKKAK